MRELTEDMQVELAAIIGVLKRIRLVMEVHGREFDDVIAAVLYLESADLAYTPGALQLGNVSVGDDCTPRMALKQDARQHEQPDFWALIEEAAERLNPLLDRPLKQIHADSGTLKPELPPGARSLMEPGHGAESRPVPSR